MGGPFFFLHRSDSTRRTRKTRSWLQQRPGSSPKTSFKKKSEWNMDHILAYSLANMLGYGPYFSYWHGHFWSDPGHPELFFPSRENSSGLLWLHRKNLPRLVQRLETAQDHVLRWGFLNELHPRSTFSGQGWARFFAPDLYVFWDCDYLAAVLTLLF